MRSPRLAPALASAVPVALVLLLALAGSASAQSVWTGAGGIVWQDPLNWSTLAVPDAGTHVVIAPAPNQPSAYADDPACASLSILPGGVLTLLAGYDLAVAGDLTLQGTLQILSPSSDVAVGGDWIHDGAFANGGAQVLFFGDGVIGGSVLSVFHDLVIQGGSRAIQSPVEVTGDVAISGGAAVDVAGGIDVLARGDWFSSAPGVTTTGAGRIVFGGSGVLATGANGLCDVRCASGARSVLTSAIDGDLELTGGTLALQEDALLAVAGDARLSGGTLAFAGSAPGPETLDVAGSVELACAIGALGPDARIRCGGDWTSSPAFAPAAGTVELAGPGVKAVLAATSFHDLMVSGGTARATVPFPVHGTLSIEDGATLAAEAPLALAAVALGGPTATLDLGGREHAVSGDWTSAGGSAVGGTVRFVAPGAVHADGAAIASAIFDAGGVRTTGALAVPGALVLASGALAIEAGARVTAGSAHLSGTLDVGAQGELDVAGDVDVQAATAGALDATSRIRFGGDWIAAPAWQPSAGVTTYAGASPAAPGAILGDARFFTLAVASGVLVATGPTTLGGDLALSGVLASAAPASVARDVVLLPGGVWAQGGLVHFGGGDWLGLGGAAIGGTIVLSGDGELRPGPGGLADVVIAGGVRVASTGTVSGDLGLLSGTLRIGADQTLTVLGDAKLKGGALGFFPSASGPPEMLRVAGDVACDAAVEHESPGAVLACGGDFASGPAFAPLALGVLLDGAAPSTVLAAGPLAYLGVAHAERTLLASLRVAGNVALQDGGVLDASQAALDVDGSLQVAASATLDLGALEHTVARDYRSAGGAAVGTGVLVLDGNGTLATGAAPVPNVRVAAGARLVRASRVAGTLRQTGGHVRVDLDQTLRVDGDLLLEAGLLSWFPAPNGVPEVIDVGGDVVAAAGAGVATPDSVVRCAGDWTSGAAFQMPAGRVELDGAAATTIAGLAPGDGPVLPGLIARDGARAVLPGTVVAVGALAVEAGARLDVGGARLEQPAGLAGIAGELAVGAGGAVALGPAATLVVGPTGTLAVRGAYGAPAAVVALGSAGYALTVAGALDARNFRFEGAGAVGVRIVESAIVLDLTAGTFASSAGGPGAALLDVRRPAPAAFAYVDFEGPPGVANVRTLGGAPIAFVDSEGALAGAAFEVDPLDLVSWVSAPTVVTAFVASADADVVLLGWATSAETQAEAWIVERATPGGAFAPIAEVPAVGPSAYAIADAAVAPQQTYVYRLIERKHHGELVVHAEDAATPWTAAPPANVLAVGPGAPYADVQAALAAASAPSPVLVLAAGTYPAFAVGPGLGALRVIAQGDVAIDTTAAPVAIASLGAADSIELVGLAIGSPGSPNPGVEIESCAGVVVLDACAVQGGAGRPGVHARAAPRVALQRCAIAGAPGLLADAGSVVVAGKGALDHVWAKGFSRVRLAQIAAAQTVEAGSSIVTLPGVHPDLDLPELASLGGAWQMTRSGEPGAPFAVAYSGGLAWSDLPAPFEMVGLIALDAAPILTTGVLSATPVVQTYPVPANGALFGLAASAQIVAVDPVTLKLRWSNVQSMVLID